MLRKPKLEDEGQPQSWEVQAKVRPMPSQGLEIFLGWAGYRFYTPT